MCSSDLGVKLTHVPYKGAAPAVVDVVGGQVSGMFVDLPKEFKGTHMSRFIEVLNAHGNVVHVENITDILHAMQKKLNAATAHLEMEFPFFLTKKAPTEIGPEKVAEVSQRDGIKYIMSDDSWLLIRPSGTEPVLRVYAEGRSQEMVKALLEYGEHVAASVV